MRPHSQDLRQRIVDLYHRGEGSNRTLADPFQVRPDSVFQLLKRYLQTDSIVPAPRRGGSQTPLKAEHHEVLRELIADSDTTLPQLAKRLAERTQLQVSPNTISRALSKLNITRKKKSFKATETYGYETVHHLR